MEKFIHAAHAYSRHSGKTYAVAYQILHGRVMGFFYTGMHKTVWAIFDSVKDSRHMQEKIYDLYTTKESAKKALVNYTSEAYIQEVGVRDSSSPYRDRR